MMQASRGKREGYLKKGIWVQPEINRGLRYRERDRESALVFFVVLAVAAAFWRFWKIEQLNNRPNTR